MIKKITALLTFCLVFATSAMAQMPEVEMADSLRQSGKIYVVVVIISIIFGSGCLPHKPGPQDF